ncbi:hypothetical protein [Cellulomonas sp. ICMP 17802]|uniref:hypothetical protein n=1 Tax=Cellulomonas sp. ICMP 17802 TaxID=3239199 RepID=UPI00351B015F
METAAQPEPLVWTAWTTDASFVRRAVGAQWRHQLRRPQLVVLEVLFGALLLLGVVTRSGPTIGVVGVVVVLGLTGYVTGRVRTARVLPAGSTIRVAVGDDRLHTQGPLGSAAVRYGVYGRVLVRRRLVLLENRTSKQLVPYPRELFPDTVLAVLQERVRVALPVGADAPADASPGAARPGEVVSFTTDAGYVRRLAGAYLREVTFAPVRVAALLATILVGSAVMVALTGDPSSGWVAGAIFAAFMVGVMVWVVWRQQVRIVRQLTRQVPAGSVFRAAVGAESLWIEGPAVAGETRWSAFRSVSVRGEFVFLQARESRVRSILPVQLFPGGSLRLVRERVGAAGPATPTVGAQAPSSTR